MLKLSATQIFETESWTYRVIQKRITTLLHTTFNAKKYALTCLPSPWKSVSQQEPQGSNLLHHNPQGSPSDTHKTQIMLGRKNHDTVHFHFSHGRKKGRLPTVAKSTSRDDNDDGNKAKHSRMEHHSQCKRDRARKHELINFICRLITLVSQTNFVSIFTLVTQSVSPSASTERKRPICSLVSAAVWSHSVVSVSTNGFAAPLQKLIYQN